MKKMTREIQSDREKHIEEEKRSETRPRFSLGNAGYQ